MPCSTLFCEHGTFVLLIIHLHVNIDEPITTKMQTPMKVAVNFVTRGVYANIIADQLD